ncbi:(d)CMP kinase [Oxalobacter vibrioformis]|uniref:Cytidylate kinase n=1 Tax=Oxalobacter vibrioformis TaxID=933080 RepID=A0A9E9P4B1_9BURK|nr:(d)CMP kinase [Oxalobacter vibrioformis]WAW11100.1 (d)CMP kinase [Oxalobacter vibrioformis]
MSILPSQSTTAFVITIDGPTASGKGTVAQIVAERLGFHYLDSGALYRLVALSVLRSGTSIEDEAAVAKLAKTLPCHFENGRIFLADDDVTDTIRAENVGNMASRVGALPAARATLFSLQTGFKRPPGLVADGRDMGTVIFPDAELKVFLTASVEARAQRRYKQLIEKGFPAKISDLRQDLHERDQRDTFRSIAPLAPAADAKPLDTTHLGIEEAVSQILEWYAAKKH